MPRQTFMYGREAISTGHYLATAAGFEILARGGNAVDAAVAAGLALAVVESSHVSLGGVAPIMIRMADMPVPVTLAGVGTWPRAVSCAAYRARFGDNIPPGVMRCVVPAAVSAWLAALDRFGTLSFADVAGAAIGFARDGFPVCDIFRSTLEGGRKNLLSWPSSAALYFPAGAAPAEGALLRNPDLAATLQFMADEDRKGTGRAAGIARVRDAFYNGDIAHELVAFVRGEGGLLDTADMAEYATEFGTAIGVKFGEVELFGCGAWCQGPMLLEALTIVAARGLDGLAHNSAGYLHRIAEAIRLAARDRERFIGDPNFVDPKLEQLLSPDHARRLAGMIRDDAALPAWGVATNDDAGAGNGINLDTSYVAVIDRFGNAISATPSDGCTAMPTIPGLGFIPSGRGNQSWTDAAHPSAIAPGKRPRLTPNPAIAVQDGKFLMPFGTPGHDAQTQIMLQVFLNIVHFGMSPLDAVEAPRLTSLDFPSSAVPHAPRPGLLYVEQDVGDATIAALRGLGHDAQPWPQSGPDYAENLSTACLVRKDTATGVISAATDSRRPSAVAGH